MNSVKKSIDTLESALTHLNMSKEQEKQIKELLKQVKDDVDTSNEEIESVRREHYFYKAALDVLPNPIFIKNEEAKFVYFNPEYEKYFHIQADDFLNKSVLDLTYLSLQERQRYQQEDLGLIKSGDVKHYETRFSLPDESLGYSLYWSKGFECEKSSQKGLVGEIVDITIQKKLRDEIIKNMQELEQAKKKIEVLMEEDSLTGLSNRRVIENFFRDKYDKSDRDYEFPAILLLDIDYFKSINDTFGHLIGDEMLKRFAEILRNSCRKEDLIIRYGGEEFLIVLFNTEKQEAHILAERIRENVESTLLLPDNTPVTVSIGVTKVEEQESFHHGMVRVDHALYQAKNQGRNKVIFV